jgi:hypothetical protein
MTCLIQEPTNRFYLTADGRWTSDFNAAREFSSIRETLECKERLHLHDATVLVFRDKRVYRVDHNEIVPIGSERMDIELEPRD